jgi:sugar lactone lactonase YvrE
MRRLLPLLLLPLLGCPEVDPPTPDAGPDPDPEPEVFVELIAGETTRGFVDGTGRGARFDSVTCLELSPDGRTLFASETFVGTLRAIDTETGEVTTPIGVAHSASVSDGVGEQVRLGEPRGLGMTPDGETLYFADSSVLRSYNLASGEVISHLGLASEPGYVDGDFIDARLGFLNHDLAVSADGASVFLADRSNDVLRVFDTAEESLGTLLGGFDGPGGLSRDGETLYVANTFAGQLQAVDLGTGEARVVASGLPNPQGVAFDGEDALYALGFDGGLRRADLTTGVVTPVTTVGVVGGAFASPVIDRDAQRLYYAELATDAIMRVDLATGQVSSLAGPVNAEGNVDGAVADARFGWIYGLAASADGRTVFIADTDNGSVRVLDRDAGEVSSISDPGWVNPVGLVLDGDTLYVSDGTAGTISRVEAGAVTPLAEGLETPWGMALADGALFVAEYGGGAVRRVSLADGTHEVFSGGYQGPLSLAADEESLYLTDFDGGSVHAIAIAGGESQARAQGLNGPSGVAVDEGVVYFTETGDHTLKALDGREPRTVLGRSGIEAAIGTDPVPAEEATLTLPEALAVTPEGLLVSVEFGVMFVPREAL